MLVTSVSTPPSVSYTHLGVYKRQVVDRRHWPHAFRHLRGRRANEALHFLRLRVPLFRCQVEKVGGQRVVTPDATAIGIHPAEAELRLGVAKTGAIAIGLRRPRGILGDAFAMLVGCLLYTSRCV